VPDRGEFFLQQLLNVKARFRSTVAQGQEFADLVEREAEFLCALNKLKLFDVFRLKEPEAPF